MKLHFKLFGNVLHHMKDFLKLMILIFYLFLVLLNLTLIITNTMIWVYSE